MDFFFSFSFFLFFFFYQIISYGLIIIQEPFPLDCLKYYRPFIISLHIKQLGQKYREIDRKCNKKHFFDITNKRYKFKKKKKECTNRKVNQKDEESSSQSQKRHKSSKQLFTLNFCCFQSRFCILRTTCVGNSVPEVVVM